MRFAPVLIAVSILLGAALVTTGQEPGAKPGINEQFKNPNVADFVKRFETNDREVYARRQEIANAVAVRPGMAVADVGAGTGVFTRLFAQAVGPKGKVYAVDIAQPFLKHIAAESKRLGQAQVHTVQGKRDTTNLPAGSVDLVFISDTYHHFEQPAKMLASIHQALRPGGQLVMVEFDRQEGKSSKFVLEHVRASKDVFLSEIEAAGFERVNQPDAPVLKENFFQRFRKKPAATAPRSP